MQTLGHVEPEEGTQVGLHSYPQNYTKRATDVKTMTDPQCIRREVFCQEDFLGFLYVSDLFLFFSTWAISEVYIECVTMQLLFFFCGQLNSHILMFLSQFQLLAFLFKHKSPGFFICRFIVDDKKKKDESLKTGPCYLFF